MIGGLRLRRLLLWALAPIAALAFSLVASSVALLLIHKDPLTAFHQMLSYGLQGSQVISIVNRATPLYLSALAVAIGFKMNLFNIGVEGQYYLAALLAATFGAAIHLPAPIHILLILLVAMGVGATWSGVAGVLKVTRGVHEVISTIMLNFIAVGVGSYLLQRYFAAKTSAADLITRTKPIPASGLFPSIDKLFGIRNPIEPLSGFVLVAALVGIVYYVLVWRTRFGFDLRASGVNPDAARASGVNPRAMVLKTMLLSGAIAGLVGMMYLLSFFGAYTLDFPTGLGFTGIAVALVGRNHPVGMGLAAMLFGFLEVSAQILDLNGVPKEVIQIMEGIIILSVVIAYELVRRLIQSQDVRAAAQRSRQSAPQAQEVPA
ncbi:MAG TPA: ABC transporter permease [Actinomycetota bacterium]|nr:ABC transporter permease [Actinomycetota bacterium]